MTQQMTDQDKASMREKAKDKNWRRNMVWKYIQVGATSKQIAELLNISVSLVDKDRGWLKMNMKTTVANADSGTEVGTILRQLDDLYCRSIKELEQLPADATIADKARMMSRAADILTKKQTLMLDAGLIKRVPAETNVNILSDGVDLSKMSLKELQSYAMDKAASLGMPLPGIPAGARNVLAEATDQN